MFKFNHFNYNILDLEKSMKFYEDALGLKEVRRKEAEDGSWKLVYLGDGKSDFTLELTWLRDRKDPYNLGENEFHLAFVTEDYDAAYAKHISHFLVNWKHYQKWKRKLLKEIKMFGYLIDSTNIY